MGNKNCCCSNDPKANAPDPIKWRYLRHIQYEDAYVLELKYEGCTNCYGKKILVYLGVYDEKTRHRDPHFDFGDTSPIARFEPTTRGWVWANQFANRRHNERY